MSEYRQLVTPELAAEGGWYTPAQIGTYEIEVAESHAFDALLSVHTDGDGNCFVIDGVGTVFVEFDSQDRKQIHAAMRWMATYLAYDLNDE